MTSITSYGNSTRMDSIVDYRLCSWTTIWPVTGVDLLKSNSSNELISEDYELYED